LRAMVHFVEFLGDSNRYHLRTGALELFADEQGDARHKAGDEVEVGWHSEDMKVFR
jgi:TOBE domain